MKPVFTRTKLASCLMGVLAGTSALAADSVSSLTVSKQLATPLTYSVGDIEYNWGQGDNELIEGFLAGGRSFGYVMSANDVVIQRDDIAGLATGEPCGVFVERLALEENSRTYAADFPSDGSSENNCQLDLVLESRIVNRGVVDVFSNKLPDAKNIERLDYLFYGGALAPLSQDQLDLAGHLVAEKGGNNPVQIAAILSLDEFGQPAAYGPLVLVSEAGCSAPDICYGPTDRLHTYSFLQNEYNAPQSFPAETERSMEVVNTAFVSAADMGLLPGQRYFGFSFFADDVEADVHDLLDPTTFPDDTADDYVVVGDDADIYGGLTGYFLADELNVAGGKLFLDANADGVPDPDEAGIGDVTVALYTDVDGDGVFDEGVETPLGDELSSNTDGGFVFPGLPDGNYLIVLDESDPDIPDGLVVAPGTNPAVLTIGGTDADSVNFSFVSESGTGSGSDSDGLIDDGTGDGVGDGSDDGTGDGAGDGSDDGTGDGAGDGSDDGTGDGAGDGSDDGTGDGAGDGSDDGTGDGAGDGSDDGTGDDAGDGSDDGTGDGAGDGSDDGTGDGAGDGSDDGTGDGAGDGSDDGTGDGAGDGSDDGTGNGVGVGTGTGDGTGEPNLDGLIGDDATTANSDTFTVKQGEQVVIDVLENDVGNGLTLVSVSSSDNADITITNDNKVLYNANYGFYTADNNPEAFTYTLQDSDGTTRTGNVSGVVRYSDLNNNQQNDFVECDCDHLLLETGIHGSGVGHMSKLTMFALALIALWRLFACVSMPLTTRNGGA